MRLNQQGFNLIELLIFIIATAILAKTVLLASGTVLQKHPRVHQNVVGLNLAAGCLEGFLLEARELGYQNAKLNVASPVALVDRPPSCTTNIPTGFTVTPSIAAATLNTDPNYKTITVTIGGADSFSLRSLIAKY